jgi:DNA-binding IclR family transcriptional regulator
MTPSDIAEIEARLKAANAHHWTYDGQAGPSGRCIAAQVWDASGDEIATIKTTDPEKFANAIAEFIALAPTDTAALLEEVKRLRKMVGETG